MRDLTGNLPMLPGVFPDHSAPIVRTAVDGVRELAMARWGMPSPTFAIAGKKTDSGVTNIRNVKSPHWRRWLGVESRCIVPFTSFAENEVCRTAPVRRYGSRSTIAARSPFSPASGHGGRRFGRSGKAKRRMTFSAS
jgi:putative SOS response-associated peptidase YedK